jgi:segregation and condensation protein A
MAYEVKISNFEGPFDLLFHLFEKNKVNIYDIPINEITDQNMEYLFAMEELNLEIASEFLLMASTLMHIKSKMLLPEKKEKQEDEIDPREELVVKLIEYKKYKDFSEQLKFREEIWDKVFYKVPEAPEFTGDDEILELSPEELVRIYKELLIRNKKKINKNVAGMAQIIQHEKVSLKSKMNEIIKILLNKPILKFFEIFRQRSKMEVVTGFLAALELAKLKKVKLEQKKQFSEIMIYKYEGDTAAAFEEIAADRSTGGII